MTHYNSVLDAAQHLSMSERLQLIEALWESLPDDAELPLDPEWESELEGRVAGLESGKATTIPWETIRDEALNRITHGQ